MVELSSPHCFFSWIKRINMQKKKRTEMDGEGETWGEEKGDRQHNQKPLQTYSKGIRVIDEIKPRDRV